MARELTEEETHQMQMIQLEILLEVKRICEMFGIKYGIDGGTLLGAVRHNGFIPWDPDIDVIMLREEYEKFFRASETYMNHKKFFLQEERTDSEYRWGFTKIRKNNTELIREGQEHLKMKNGIFIDILIMDYVPDHYLPRKLHKAFCAYSRFVMWSEVGKYWERNTIKRFMYKLANHIPVKSIFRQLRYVRTRCNARPSKYVRYMTCRYTYNKKLEGIKADFFNSYDYYMFENYKFPGFSKYDEYLTILYGDYMRLPPPESQKSHMPVASLKFKIGKGMV